MTRSYFPRIVALVLFILSGLYVLSQAAEYLNAYAHNGYNSEHRSWMFPNSYFKKKKPYPTDPKVRKRFFFKKDYHWLFMQPRAKKEGDQTVEIVQYQAEDAIVFDAKKNILSLHGTSVLAYDNMKLEANAIALHLNANTITAEGGKDRHNQPLGNPIFTYKDVTKNKYGKSVPDKTRTFFMEKIHYNIETKRVLVHKLLTKQEESIVKSKQVKKEDEETFYSEDLIYTTCLLAHPHFYIRTKRAKMIEDKQITTGPFRFYFDDVPTPLGCFFGTLFLEGKRTHGIIPPDIGEEESNGFYLRNGGYYINFNDYADISILGSIYANGITELKNELRYKKRYLCSGNIGYARNSGDKERGWSLKWTHKTLTHSNRSLNANVTLHNKGHKTFDHDDQKIPTKTEHQSSGSLSYQDKLAGFPYGLNVQAKYENNLLSKFKHWTLPTGTLSTSAWYPFRSVQSGGTTHWFHKIYLKHTINFENHFQNAKKDPVTQQYANKSTPPQEVPSTHSWNHYRENGMRHTIPLSMECKLFKYINLTPHFTYNEGWYWFEKGTTGPIKVPGFNRVYSWNFGGTLGTTLYHTHYFNEAELVQGFRIKTEPSVTFTYTPDFSAKYFQKVENDKGEKEKKYAFKGLRPEINLTNRATSILTCELKNRVELKVKKAIDPDKKEKQQSSRKVPLLKNLDFKAKYDFKAAQCRLTEGIDMHMASEAKVGEMGKIGLDLTANFDPYLSKIVDSDHGGIKEEQIDAFAWDNGQYLGKVKKVRWKINMDFTSSHHSSEQKKKKKTLLSDRSSLINKIEEKENKIDFETPWNFSWEFNWIYDKLYAYKRGEKDYKTEKYITFNGGITLVKKWKVSLRSTYNFTTSKLDPSATAISIQRDLHCWQLSYEWHPLGDQSKYDFSLGVKANVLKALKLPKKRAYNKL